MATPVLDSCVAVVVVKPAPEIRVHEVLGEFAADLILVAFEEMMDTNVRWLLPPLNRSVVPVTPFARKSLSVLEEERHSSDHAQALSWCPAEPAACCARVDVELPVDEPRHPWSFERPKPGQTRDHVKCAQAGTAQDSGEEEGCVSLSIACRGGRRKEIAVGHGTVRAREDYRARFDRSELRQENPDEHRRVPDVEERNRRPPSPGQNPTARGVRQPGLQEIEQRLVLTPIGEECGKPDDAAVDLLTIVGDHPLTQPLALRIGILPIWRRGFGDNTPVRWKGARRDRAREDKGACSDLS